MATCLFQRHTVLEMLLSCSVAPSLFPPFLGRLPQKTQKGPSPPQPGTVPVFFFSPGSLVTTRKNCSVSRSPKSRGAGPRSAEGFFPRGCRAGAVFFSFWGGWLTGRGSKLKSWGYGRFWSLVPFTKGAMLVHVFEPQRTRRFGYPPQQ